jgi:hypothetical protein
MRLGFLAKMEPAFAIGLATHHTVSDLDTYSINFNAGGFDPSSKDILLAVEWCA